MYSLQNMWEHTSCWKALASSTVTNETEIQPEGGVNLQAPATAVIWQTLCEEVDIVLGKMQ